VYEERRAGTRWPSAAPVALEERHPDLGLERRNRLGHRGLRVGEGVRRRRERAVLSDLAEDPETLRAEHKRSLSKRSEESLALLPRSWDDRVK